jgi:hypothetical protein
MGRMIESVLYKGFIVKKLTISCLFNMDLNDPKYPPIKENESGDVIIDGGFAIKIKIGMGAAIWVPRNKYHAFVTLLDKATIMTQENLFELFPNVGSEDDSDINGGALDRFQKEKALNTAGFTMMPALWTDYGKSLPGIQMSDEKDCTVTLPLEECIAVNHLFKLFEPHSYVLQLVSMIAKVE